MTPESMKTIKVRDIQEILGVCPATVHTWLKTEELKGFKPTPRGHWHILYSDFETFVNARYGALPGID